LDALALEEAAAAMRNELMLTSEAERVKTTIFLPVILTKAD